MNNREKARDLLKIVECIREQNKTNKNKRFKAVYDLFKPLDSLQKRLWKASYFPGRELSDKQLLKLTKSVKSLFTQFEKRRAYASYSSMSVELRNKVDIFCGKI